eukprot:jgi/Chlat1/2317/Chrsp17S00169
MVVALVAVPSLDVTGVSGLPWPSSLLSRRPPRRQRLPCRSTAVTATAAASPPRSSPQPATLLELESAVEAAHLAGLAYRDPPGEGLTHDGEEEANAYNREGRRGRGRWTLLAGGHTACTSWFVADNAHTNTRHFTFRGVNWSGLDFGQQVEVRRQLARFLPTRLPLLLSSTLPMPAARAHTHAHAGVVDIAMQVLPELYPYMDSLPAGWTASFGGHSLGGSIACVLATVALHDTTLSSAIPLETVHCFGSPPVFVDITPETECRMPPVRTYVLGRDAVPRAFMLGPLQLYRHLGRVFHLDGKHAVEDVDGALLLAEDDDAYQPMAMLDSVRDHQHAHYEQALQAALRSERIRTVLDKCYQARRSRVLL